MPTRVSTTLASVLTVAVTLLLSACTLDKQDAPSSLIGPSGYALSVTMTATPDVLPRDGSSSSVVQLIARGADGQPLAGQRFLLSVSGGKLTERDVVTDAAGQKTFGYVAPALTENVSVAEIFASPVGANADNTVDRRVVSIRLVGPGFPTADFTFTPAAPGQFDQVTFDASPSLYQGVSCGNTCSYSWDFGDGMSGSGLLTTHRFESQGLFKVTLTVSTPDGTSGTRIKDVTVGSARPLTAVILYTPTNPQAGDEVTFDGRSSTSPDGSSIVDYQWDFGNGATGEGATAKTTFPDGKSYLVRLTIRDSAGRTATTTTTVTPGAPPPPAPTAPLTPVITFSPTTIVVGQPVIFDCRSSSTAAGATISSCEWDFGNGTTGSGTTAPATYAAAGTYTVRLTVGDSLGRTATTTTTAAVGAAPPTAPLTPVIFYSPTNPAVNQTVTFNGLSSTTAPGATISSYAWDFGNGQTGTGSSASTSYSTAQTYTVRLTIGDSLGRTATTTTTLTIAAGSPSAPLTPVISYSPTNPLVNQTVNFNGLSSTTAAGATITGYAWDFGNGSMTTGATASTTYPTAQTYTVRLTIDDSLGRSATTTTTITVELAPLVANFTFSKTDPAPGETVFVNASTSTTAPGGTIVSYEWDFGNGLMATGVTASTSYATAGTFTVNLKVTDSLGRVATTSKTLTVGTPMP